MAFATLSLTEPVGLHMGNTLSMMMLIAGAWAWRPTLLQPRAIRAPELVRGWGDYPFTSPRGWGDYPFASRLRFARTRRR
jgi:hypothetical protein